MATPSRGGSTSMSDADLAAAANYRKNYSASGLRKLVSDRLGFWPKLRNTKDQNIRLLLQDDIKRGAEEARGDAPFRFLDLPAEMRNQIYDLLLTDDSTNGNNSYNTAIVLACKQTRFEATSILYDKHELEIQFRAARAGESGHKFDIKTAIGKTVLTVRSSRASSLDDVNYDWKPYLLHCRTLRISLRLMTKKDTSLTVANHILARLVSFLALNNRIMKIDFRYSYEVTKAKDMTADLQNALWPITRLLGVPNLTVNGNFPAVNQHLTEIGLPFWNSGVQIQGRDAFADSYALLAKADRLHKVFKSKKKEDDERAQELVRLSATIRHILHAKVQFDESVLTQLNERLKDFTAYIEQKPVLLEKNVSEKLHSRKDASGLSWSKFLTKGVSKESEAIWKGLK